MAAEVDGVVTRPLLPTGGRWRIVAIAAAAACVSQAFGRFTYSLLFTDIRDDLAISNTLGGAIGSAGLGAYLLGSLVVSLIVGRLGLDRILRWGTVGVTASLAGLAWGPNLALVALFSTVAGFFGALVWITAPGMATAELGPHRRGLVVGVVGAGIGAGIVVSSLLAVIFGSEGWRTVYLVEAALGLVVSVVVLAVVRGRPTPGQRLETGGLNAIREVPGWLGLLVAYGLFALALSLVMTFTVAVLEHDGGWPKADAAAAFTALGLGTVLGGPLFGPLSDRIGRSRVLTIAFVIVAATGIALPLGRWPWSLFVAFAFGMAFTGVPTTVTARINDFVDGPRFGAAFGAATLAFGAGLLTGPQLGGAIADWTSSFRPAFYVVTASAVAGAVLAAKQPR